ncbi:hypothetical protein J3R83DRAFT_11623 [Lanmaoa asiatica]|nr:hypothetical protein J3R83DRAFT_11623 [Lanmaoa asiatica]
MKPIETLKKGLGKLRQQISDQKMRLEAALKARQPVSDADQDWLDNEMHLQHTLQLFQFHCLSTRRPM